MSTPSDETAPDPSATVSESFTLETPRGDLLYGTLDRPSLPGRRPAIVLSHGFKGFQEWAFLPYLADLLAARGFVAVRFNFRGSGMRPGDALVTDLDAFRAATPTRDVEDLLEVVGRLDEIGGEHIDAERIGLFGHSRGGAVSVLGAARAPRRVSALVTWSAVASFDRASAEEKELWRRQGSLPIVNTRTGQELPVGVELLDDVERHADRLDVLRIASEIAAPWLIVHGEDDETAPVEEGRSLGAAAGPGHEYLEIAGAGHTFGVGHPFAGPSRELTAAMNATQTWFRRHLTPTRQ